MVEKLSDKLIRYNDKNVSLDLRNCLNIVIDVVMDHNTDREDKLDQTLMFLINKIELAPKYVLKKEFKLCQDKLKLLKDIIDNMINEVEFVQNYISNDLE
jgi:hypothetical protein